MSPVSPRAPAMPSPVFLLLSNTNWPSVKSSDEAHFTQGLRSWDMDPTETVGGSNLLQALLTSYARRETPFLNDMVHALLDRGVDAGPALADAAQSSLSTPIKWRFFPTLLRVLQSRSQGLETTDDLNLGLALLDTLSKPMSSSSQVIAEMELLLGEGVDQGKLWERPIEGLKASVWLALRSVDNPGKNIGWKPAFSSSTESGVHKMRVLKGILGAALREGALTDEEVWVIGATMASMASQHMDSQTERRQALTISKSFMSMVQGQLPSQARKTHDAIDGLVKDWPEEARQRLVRALMQAATERLSTTGGASFHPWVDLIRFAMELAITPTTNLLPNQLASKALTYWMGNLDQRAAAWAKTEEGVQLAIALWAASWNDKADPGGLAKSVRKDWMQALGRVVHDQSKPLGAQWPTVQALVAGAMAHPEAFLEWKPLQAFINQDSLGDSLQAVPCPATAKPRL